MATLIERRRVFGAIKCLTLEEIKELQELAELNRQLPRWKQRGKRLIQIKRARMIRKPA